VKLYEELNPLEIDTKELKVIMEEAKISELSNTELELDIFDTSFEQNLATLPNFCNTSNSNSLLIVAFFFSSSVRTIGTTSSYFLESSYIRIENNELHDPLHISEQSSLEDLFDKSLELEIPEREDHNILANTVNKLQRTLCCLNDEFLLCENKGSNNVFCLREHEENEMKFIMSITGNSGGISKKIRIQENDIILIVTAVISEEKVLELIKRIAEGKDPKEIPIRCYSKEIVKQLESNTIIIAARVSKGI